MGIEFRAVTESDLDAIHRARKESWPRGPLGSGCVHERGAPDMEEWSWRHRGGFPCRRAFVALDGKRVLAHAALLMRPVWAGGKERYFAELVDAFEARSGGGLYALTLRALLDARPESGSDAPAETVVHARPAPGEARALERLLGFETVRTEPWLLGEVQSDAGEAAGRAEPIERFGEDARWLWDRCSGDFAASTLRDAAYLNWRFFERPGQRPGQRYVALGVREEGVLRGFIVLAPQERGEAWRIVDWLVPPAEPAVAEALLAAAHVTAHAAGAVVLEGLIVPWSAWFAWFQERGFRVQGRSRFLLARSFLRKFDDLWLREGWWTTLSDSIED